MDIEACRHDQQGSSHGKGKNGYVTHVNDGRIRTRIYKITINVRVVIIDNTGWEETRYW